MPKDFVFNNAGVSTLDDQRSASLSRILAMFDNGSGVATDQVASERAVIVMKSAQGYGQSLAAIGSETYEQTAGTDISALMYPAQLTTGTAKMPTFHENVTLADTRYDASLNFYDMLPVFWEYQAPGYLIDRSLSFEYDCMPASVTSDQYYGSINRFVDPSNIRTLGIRLPMLGVGWGYTTEGDPWPSGSDNSLFAGDTSRGYNMDPKNYIVAPIELRYDKSRHVWSSPKDILAEVTEVDGYKCAWIERTHDADGVIVEKPYAASGSLVDRPAIETNLRENTVGVGSYIWLKAKDVAGAWLFDGPASGVSQDPEIYDIYAKVSSGDTTTGYLNDKLRGDNVWIETEVISPSGEDEKLRFNHIGPSGYDPEKSIYVLETLDSETPGSINGTVNEIRFDPRGHYVESYHSDGFDISIEVPSCLGDLEDVSVASPSGGELLRYNSGTSKWEKVSTEVQTVVTAMRVDGVLVQIKTRDIAVIAAGDQSDWTTVHTGTDCSGV